MIPMNNCLTLIIMVTLVYSIFVHICSFHVCSFRQRVLVSLACAVWSIYSGLAVQFDGEFISYPSFSFHSRALLRPCILVFPYGSLIS
jgi:hypothetical protein